MEEPGQPLIPSSIISMKRKQIGLIALTVGSLGLIGFATIERKPDHLAYCSECGAMKVKSGWGIRSSETTLIDTTRVEQTPYSSVLENRKLVSAHSHKWLPPRQVPDPVNEFGPKVTESLEYINSPRVVSFMENLAEYGDLDMVNHWKQMTLDPQYSHVLDASLIYVNAPVTGFGDAATFRRWFQNNSAAFQARLAWLTTAD